MLRLTSRRFQATRAFAFALVCVVGTLAFAEGFPKRATRSRANDGPTVEEFMQRTTPPASFFARRPAPSKDNPPSIEDIPLDQLQGQHADRARAILSKPVAFHKGRRELFPCEPSLLKWLIDHPEVVCEYWKELGITVADMKREKDEYVCREETGSTVRFSVVCDRPGLRICYCIGESPAGILPMKLRAELVIVHRYQFETFEGAGTYVSQQLDGFASASGPTLKLAMKLAPGHSTEMVHACVQEMKLFFSVMSRLMQTRPGWSLEKLPAIAQRTECAQSEELATILKGIPDKLALSRFPPLPESIEKEAPTVLVPKDSPATSPATEPGSMKLASESSPAMK